MESFRRLGREGSEFIDQLAMSVVGGRDGGALVKNGICNELLQIFSVASQVDISRRVPTWMLASRDRQATGGRRKEEGVLMPISWVCYIQVKYILKYIYVAVSWTHRFCCTWHLLLFLIYEDIELSYLVR